MLLYTFIYMLFVSLCFSQDQSDNLFLKGKMHYGFLMPHHRSIEYSVQKHIPSFEVDLFQQTQDGLYEELYRYPRIGIGYFYSGLSNPQVYGQAHAIFPYMNIPFFPGMPTFQLNYRIAFGMAYLNKKFDVEQNISNVAIGTHLNIYFNFSFNAYYRITENIEFVSAVGLTHFSNGNVQKPNLGLNLITGSTGLNYKLLGKPGKDKPILNEKPPALKKYAWSVIYSGGFRTYEFTINKKYFASSLVLNAARNINYKRKAGLGLDIFYSGAIAPAIEKRQNKKASFGELWQTGIHGLYDVRYNKMILTLQLGYYVYASYKQKPIYTRIGMNYKINRHIMANLSLKTHYAIADYIEWGIGYCW